VRRTDLKADMLTTDTILPLGHKSAKDDRFIGDRARSLVSLRHCGRRRSSSHWVYRRGGACLDIQPAGEPSVSKLVSHP
jgi:hypothetical protein